MSRKSYGDDYRYEPGMIEVVGGGLHAAECEETRNMIRDRGDQLDDDDCFCRGMNYETPVIRLPHRCDEWVIGDADAAKSLIADLWKAIEKVAK